MPLRDHFRPPLDDKRHWQGMHGTWPAMIVASLRKKLPNGFFAEPTVQSGQSAEIDVSTFEDLDDAITPAAAGNGVGVATAVWAPPRPTNLYGELLALIGQADPRLGAEPPSLYASACRMTKRGDDWLLESWLHSLELGALLPTMPLWLADNLAVPVELEKSYEDGCEILGIA